MGRSKSLQFSDAKAALRPHGLYLFAAAIADGIHPIEAAKKCKSPLSAEELMDHPEFSGALIAVVHRKFAVELGPKALARLDGLLDSNDARVRLAAVKLVFDKTVPDVKRPDQDPGDKDLSAMTKGELHTLVERLEGELAGRATDVTPGDNAPNSAPNVPNALDLLK